MFDAQKLLGRVLREAAGGGGLGGGRRRKGRGGSITGLPRGLEAKVGMGLLGLAIAAYEHFRQSPPGATAAPGGPPPAPMPVAGQRTAATPPPPPPGHPGPAASVSPSGEPAQERSLHLLRVMIAAANADGAIDATERAGLLDRAREAGLDDEDLAGLEHEIASPLELEPLLRLTPPDLREEAYVAALLAIDADHPHEHAFLDALASGLRLDAAAQARLRTQFDLA